MLLQFFYFLFFVTDVFTIIKHSAIFHYRCVHYDNIPPQCYLVKDPVNECCNIPKCTFPVNYVTHMGELVSTTLKPPGGKYILHNYRIWVFLLLALLMVKFFESCYGYKFWQFLKIFKKDSRMWCFQIKTHMCRRSRKKDLLI